MDITKSREESRKQFEYEAGKALCLPTSIIELARKGDGYDHAFDSMNIMHPLNGWWHWWKLSRESIEVELPEPGHYDRTSQFAVDVYEAISAAGIRIKGES
ncbi:hypothetical protein [Yersinia frederiksenii]|uniref:Uncharacterized protein n=1 Tax=Yersinia frederiksenii TaxID=29484 RepID=A0AAI8ZPZ1_YERFR|nr:hypothetical protein [Yersinia frederiksenii]CFQ96795.1 Uncharacterised protein [Yersinia frederiksenii]